MPSYKRRIWDGKIRLYSVATNEVYVGLLPYIEEFAKRNEIDIEYKEGILNERKYENNELDRFIRRVSPKSKGKDLEIRDYQRNAFSYAVGNNSLLLSPTASGKSLIIYLLSRWYEKENVLILVPTTSLVEQMYSDFIDYGYDDTKMQKIYQGHSKDITKPITISTWQSLYKLPRKFFENFGCILGDEVHLFKAKSLTGIMNKSISCKYRHGFTGTLDGTQTHRLILEGLFGSVNRVTTTKELMDKKTLAKLNIKCIVLQYPEVDCKFMKTQKFQDEVDLIVRDERRNKFVVNLTKYLKGNTLVLFQFVEKHGAVLYDMMKDLNRKVFYVHGGTDAQTRENIREITEKKKMQSSLHHTVLFLLGLTFAIFIMWSLVVHRKSRIRVLQSIGRGLRQGTENLRHSL